MRKINEDEFVNFTIDGNGWTLTVYGIKKALGEWKNITRAGSTLYGNKADGSRAILDSK